MKTIFLTDVDGTLLKTGNPVHESVSNAVSDFLKNGGYFALSTGRAASAVEPIVDELRVNAPCILLGGALCYDFTNHKSVWSVPLDPSFDGIIRTVWERYPGISITVYTECDTYNLRINERLSRKGVYEDRTAPLVDQDCIKDPLMKILFTSDDVAMLRRIGHLHIDTDIFEYAASSTYFYEITAQGISKGTAVKKLCDSIVGEEDYILITAGDAHTDLTMQPYSDAFYAPITAPEDVKEKADGIFDPPNDGGIAEIIRKYIPISGF